MERPAPASQPKHINIGIVGLGIIGRAIAGHLRRKGFSVFVWNRSPRPVPNFVGSPGELAGLSNYIQIFVSDDEALLQSVEQLSEKLTSRHIIFAHSSLPQERFGEILTRLGKIGAEEFNAVVREVAEGKRLGETLVERGYISTMDLYVGLNYQVQHILYSVFDWDFGLYEFEEEIRNVQQEIAVRVSTPDLVVRGVRNITNLTVLDRAVGDESRVPLPQGTPRLHPGRRQLVLDGLLRLHRRRGADGGVRVASAGAARHERQSLHFTIV